MTALRDARVDGLTQLLQQQPRAYRGFGWLWWTVKAALKAHVSAEQLFLLGPSNEPAMIRLAAQTYGTASDALNAAIDHYRERALRGHVYAFDDHLPDGAAYHLYDDDAGYANL